MKPLLYSLILVLGIGCASKQHHEEEAIREFLTSFESSLAGPDSLIAQHFVPGMDISYAWAALRLLQNKKEHLQISPRFAAAEIVTDENGVAVILPVGIAVLMDGAAFPKEDQSIRLELSKMDGKVVIESFVGGDFYSYCSDFIMEATRDAEEGAWQKFLQPYAERANAFVSNGTYDSVAWFCRYDDVVYYYVIKEAESAEDKRWQMGLVDEEGKVIVPAEFDRIGTPGLIIGRGVETYKDGKVGLYSLDGAELFAARHTWIAPYQGPPSSVVLVVAQHDEGTAWLDNNYGLHEDITDEGAKAYVEKQEFLKLPFSYSYEDTPICVKVDASYSEGFVLPANYLVRFGLTSLVLKNFIVPGYVTDEANFGTKYESSSGGIFVNLSDGLRLLISNFEMKFIGGRSEFYNSNKFTVLSDQDTIRTALNQNVNYKVRQLEGDLLEAVVTRSEWPLQEGKWISTDYTYYRYSTNGLEALQSSRKFEQSQFVRMDSSYLYVDDYTTHGKMWDPEFVDLVRMDILFDLGLAVEGEFAENFNFNRKTESKFKTYAEAYAAGSEIDKYNLDFIQRLIGPYPYKPAAASPVTP